MASQPPPPLNQQQQAPPFPPYNAGYIQPTFPQLVPTNSARPPMQTVSNANAGPTLGTSQVQWNRPLVVAQGSAFTPVPPQNSGSTHQQHYNNPAVYSNPNITTPKQNSSNFVSGRPPSTPIISPSSSGKHRLSCNMQTCDNMRLIFPRVSSRTAFKSDFEKPFPGSVCQFAIWQFGRTVPTWYYFNESIWQQNITRCN